MTTEDITETREDGKERVRDAVRAGYGEIARNGRIRGAASCCGAGAAEQVARAVGYDEADLATLPEGANMGLSCGNPTAIAALRPGEVVLDLGSGGGFDVFIAGRKVGPAGHVIGVDMTADMLVKARRNIAAYRQESGLDNVEFRLGEIEHLPVADASIDVVLSNCVLNLSPDKPQVWYEIARVLRPGGRVAVSDLALLQPLPDDILKMVEALVGCVAGAVPVEQTRRMADAAGLADIVLSPKADYLDVMADWQDPLYRAIAAWLPAGAKASDFITKLDVSARKDGAPQAIYAPSVAELVAIGAAVAANCEACFKYHYDAARRLGVSRQDVAKAVAMARAVKEAPATAILALAARFTGGEASAAEAGVPARGTCCGR